MPAVPPPAPNEPPPPQLGLTREERGRDVSEAQAEAEAETSKVQQYLRAMSPRYVLSMAEGYPVVIKQFLQFCLIIIYPVLWLLFWPMRSYQKKNHPEEYEATRQKFAKKQ
jgi:YggT family protein